jgi:hypothetical protein
MICFSTDYMRRKQRERIRLRQPGSIVLFSGCDKERINAVFDGHHRILQLIVHTRTRQIR